MDREKVIEGLETIKRFFGYGLPSTAEMFDSYYGILNDAIAMLKEQEAEIAFLKAMQLQTVHNMSNEDIGNAVRNVLRL